MRAFGATLIASLLVAGCSSSTNSLLKEADPAACATSEVKELVIDGIKDGASLPSDLENTPEVQELKQTWLEKVDVSLDTISSDQADITTQSVSCSAKIKITAEGIAEPIFVNGGWRLKANLANDDPLVSLDVFSAELALGSVFRFLAAPLYKAQREQRAADLDSRRASFAQQYQPAIDAEFASIQSIFVPDAFSESQMRDMALYSMIRRFEATQGPRSDIDTLAWASKISDGLREQNICTYGRQGFSYCDDSARELVRTRVLSSQQSSLIAEFKSVSDRCSTPSFYNTSAEEGWCARKAELESQMDAAKLCKEDDGGSGRWVPCAGIDRDRAWR